MFVCGTMTRPAYLPSCLPLDFKTALPCFELRAAHNKVYKKQYSQINISNGDFFKISCHLKKIERGSGRRKQSARAHMSSGKQFHQVEDTAEKTLALFEDSWTPLKLGTTSRFLSSINKSCGGGGIRKDGLVGMWIPVFKDFNSKSQNLELDPVPHW